MDIRENPILVSYPDVKTAKEVADKIGISYKIVRYSGQSVVWIIKLGN